MAATNTNPVVDVSLFVRKTDKADTYAQAVIRLLNDGHWHSAKSICQDIPELTTRDLRDIRKNSRGSIIGGGQGYRLTLHASKEEVDRYIRLCYKNMREYSNTAVQVENFRNRRRR